MKYTACRLLLCLFVMGGAGCSRTSDTPADMKPGQAQESISVCQGGAFSTLPLIAWERGLFAGQGLNAAIIGKGDGKLAMDALLAGECTFATVGEPPLVTNLFARSDFVILASLNVSSNATKIIARTDSGIRTVADLKGKPVGVRKGSFSHYFFDLALTKNGMRPQEVKMRFMEPGLLPDALARGEIVAYSGSDEQLLKGKKQLGDKSIILAEPGLSLNSVNLVTTKAYAASHAGVVRKILAALLQAEEFGNKNPGTARKIVQRLKGISAADLDEVLKDQSHQVSLPQSLLLTLEGNARWMIDNNMVESAVVPNFLSVIDQTSLKALKPSAVTVNR